MKKIIISSLMDMKHSKLFMLLTMVVCFVSFLTMLTSMTSISSSFYQRKEFEENIGFDKERILHLRFSEVEENEEFIKKYQSFLSQVEELDEISIMGRFDQTGEYFLELENNKEYSQLNEKILKNNHSKYLKHSNISRVMYMDKETQLLIKDLNLLFEYEEMLPIYVSESFKNIIEMGQILTNIRTDEEFIVVGYIPTDKSFYDENDLIRFPLMSLEGYFIAPFPDGYKEEVMSLLSTLHNTYLVVKEDEEVAQVRELVYKLASEADVEIEIYTIAEEFKEYCKEKDYFIKAQGILALFIFVMASSCVVAIFTTNTILKKREYGILLANGFSKIDLVFIVFCELAIIIFISALLAWIIKLLEFSFSNSLSIVIFRTILYKAHLSFTLPMCLMACIILVLVSLLLPLKRILSYEPSELIKGENMDEFS